MELSLQKQRKDLDEASRVLESKIKELQYERQVLINAFNSIDQNGENILESGSILAQDARRIMTKLINS
jgi:prefoldin subunit 5